MPITTKYRISAPIELIRVQADGGLNAFEVEDLSGDVWLHFTHGGGARLSTENAREFGQQLIVFADQLEKAYAEARA